MTQSLTTPQTTPATSPEVTVQTTRIEVIDRIMAEVKAALPGIDAILMAAGDVYDESLPNAGALRAYTRKDAGALIDELTDIATQLGSSEEEYYLSQEFLDRHHDVMNIVMPDNYVRNGLDIAPGSAYAGINAVALTGQQLTFEHTKAFFDATDHCVVTAHIRVV